MEEVPPALADGGGVLAETFEHLVHEPCVGAEAKGVAVTLALAGPVLLVIGHVARLRREGLLASKAQVVGWAARYNCGELPCPGAACQQGSGAPR